MKLDERTVADLAIRFQPSAYLRVMPHIHAATPLGMGFGQTRFASPTNSFKVLYAAFDLATAVAETVIRDRFEGQARRVLDVTEIAEWDVAEISASDSLILLDLRTTGLLRLGISTDAARAKDQSDGRALSQALHARYALDGIIYQSRLTASPCIALYERAILAGKIVASQPNGIIMDPRLVPALEYLSVDLLGFA